MGTRKQLMTCFAVGLNVILVTPSAIGGVVYDLGDFPFVFSGATSLSATLETSTTGTFTTEAEIESFFNSATYSVILMNGAATLWELNNNNSSWDLQFQAAPGGSAVLTSTPTGLTLDFSTPDEVSSIVLILGSPPSIFLYRQSNNVSNFNIVHADHNAVSSAHAPLPYDAPFVFPAHAFYTVDPCRVIDTRNADGPFGGPALVAGAVRTFTIAGQCGIPTAAQAVSVSFAVTQPSATGHLRLYPGGAIPAISSINYLSGRTVSNNGVVALNTSGQFSVFVGQASGTVHFILDVNGYFK